MVFNATFSNISVISWRSVFIGVKVFLSLCSRVSGFFILHYPFCFSLTFINKGKYIGVRVMVFNATLDTISAISWRSVCIGGGNWSTRRKPPTCRKCTDKLYHLINIIINY